MSAKCQLWLRREPETAAWMKAGSKPVFMSWVICQWCTTVTHKFVFHSFWFIRFWILLDHQGQTFGSQTCQLLPRVWLSRAAGIEFDFPSTVVLNGFLAMADTVVMLIEGTEVVPLCISFMVVKRHWAIPGRNDKSLVINFFYLHSW